MTMVFSYIIILLITALVFIAYFKGHKTKKTTTTYNLPPGSSGLPLVGESISFFRALTRNKPAQWIRDRVERHGPVFRTSFLGTNTVVLTGQAGNRFVFSCADGALTLNQPGPVAKIFGKYGLFEMTFQRHKLVRGVVAAFLKPESIQRYFGAMESVIRQNLSKELDGKDSVCVVPLMKNLTFDVSNKIFFGLPDGEERDKLLEEFTTAVEGLWAIPLDFPGTLLNRALKAREKLSKRLLKIIGIRRKQIEEGMLSHDDIDVIASLLLLKVENGEPMRDIEIVDTLVGLIIASHDTVSVVLSHFIRLLATNSEVFERVLEEQREVANGKRKISNGGDINEVKLSWSDVQMMKYTWRVAQELMRLTPPVFGNFRRVVRDTKFDSYDIPKGWQVFWVNSETHLNNDIFEDPYKFDPSRFESQLKSYPPYTYIPFGAGPRVCPGADFARVEIILVIHHMMTKYRWTQMIPDEPISFKPAPLPTMGLPILLRPIDDI